MLGLNIDLVPVDSLTPFDGNPRVGDVGAIAESLNANGQYRPLVVRAETREILAGNHTWQAAKHLGWAEVAVSWLSGLNDEQAKRIVLADNRYSDLATYDDEALVQLLGSLGDLTGSGYTDADLSSLWEALEASKPVEALTGVDDVPDLPEVAQSRLGDVWSLGRHRLLVGDSTQDLTPLMQGDEASLVFTDPPWNVNYGDVAKGNKQGYKVRKIMNDNQGQLFNEFCDAFSLQLKAHSRPGAPIYLVMSAQEWPVVDLSLRTAGFHWSSTIIWAKDQLVLSRKDYHTQYEPIWYGWNDSGPRLVPVADRKQSDVWQIARPKRSELHPTTKPVELIARAIGNSTQVGDIVLDAFGGSGSTLIACHQEHRTARLVELDPRYADVILQRYMEHTGVTPTNQLGVPFNG